MVKFINWREFNNYCYGLDCCYEKGPCYGVQGYPCQSVNASLGNPKIHYFIKGFSFGLPYFNLMYIMGYPFKIYTVIIMNGGRRVNIKIVYRNLWLHLSREYMFLLTNFMFMQLRKRYYC